jgi:hypothetical protein
MSLEIIKARRNFNYRALAQIRVELELGKQKEQVKV